MQTTVTRTMSQMIPGARSCLGLAVVCAVHLSVSSVQAQRPSFGGLFTQVQDMLTGEESFQAVAFGPTGQCRIGVDPTGLTGLTVSDPVGFRLMGDRETNGFRLLFGPTFDCVVEVQPRGIPGLILRDPKGIRILPPLLDPPLPPILTFGDTEDCRILVDPVVGGMTFQDPNYFRFENIRGIPVVQILQGFVQFGEACTLGIDLEFPGIAVKDPRGLRLLGQKGEGSVLTFGPTEDCRILADPILRPEAGLILTDPNRFTFESPLGAGAAVVDVSGAVVAQEFVQKSSRHLKENIRTIDNALETVLKLRGVRFDWTKDVRKSGGSELGFVAEEVAEVASEAAAYDAEHNATGVKYANLVALTIEGLKAQQMQIDAQQKLIAELQKQVEALQAGQ